MSRGIVSVFLILAAAIYSSPQSSSIHSSGVDGALNITAPGEVLFDPKSFKPPLDPDGDNVYHFTTIHIGKDVKVKLSSKFLNGPVFWLAQGPVQIDGVIDLNGDNGDDPFPSLAGAGGYAGGPLRRPGYGPEGFTRNIFLVPLVGGNGGDGGETHGGGAGGGALLIASNSAITVNGAITADGGSATDGAGGNGGSIRLSAPLIDGSGLLSAKSGTTQSNQKPSDEGRIRFEAFQNAFTGDFNSTPFSQGKPLGLFLPSTSPHSARVISIGGADVTKPEITLKEPTNLAVVIEAQNVPTGTVLVVECFSEGGIGQKVSTTPLEGTFERSLANALVSFPDGLSRCWTEAKWKLPQPPGK